MLKGIIAVETFFSDSSCSTEAGAGETTTGTFSIGSTVTTDSGVTAYELDVTWIDEGVTINSPNIVHVDGSILLYR